MNWGLRGRVRLRTKRIFCNSNCIAPLHQVPKGRNNEEPGTEVPGIKRKQMSPGRDGTIRRHCVPSLSGLDHFPALPCRALHCYVPSGLIAVV
jgi:hypothetical protein